MYLFCSSSLLVFFICVGAVFAHNEPFELVSIETETGGPQCDFLCVTATSPDLYRVSVVGRCNVDTLLERLLAFGYRGNLEFHASEFDPDASIEIGSKADLFAFSGIRSKIPTHSHTGDSLSAIITDQNGVTAPLYAIEAAWVLDGAIIRIAHGTGPEFSPNWPGFWMTALMLRNRTEFDFAAISLSKTASALDVVNARDRIDRLRAANVDPECLLQAVFIVETADNERMALINLEMDVFACKDIPKMPLFVFE